MRHSKRKRKAAIPKRIPLPTFSGGGALIRWPNIVFISMSFNETSEAEIARINKHFPNRSPEEVKQAIETAKANFHGSRGGSRVEILAQMLS
jgi:hypothetical protein